MSIQEKQHLFGDSVDLDNNTRPLLFDDVSNLYQDVTPRQLTALVEEGVNHLVTEGAESKEDVDILRPIIDVCYRDPFHSLDFNTSFASQSIL